MAAAAQEKPQAPPGDKKAVSLRWRFVPGQHFYQVVTTEVKCRSKLLQKWSEQKEVQQTGSSTLWSEWQAVDLTNDQLALEQKLLGMKFDTEIGGNSVKYDSRQRGPRDALALTMDKFRGATFQVTLAPDGTPKGVTGLQKVLQAAFGDLAQVAQGSYDWHLRQAAEATFAFGPSGQPKVHKGDSWTRKTMVDLGRPFPRFSITSSYTYRGKQGKYDKIVYEMTLSNPRAPLAAEVPPPAASKVTTVRLNTATGSGVILFDRAKGRLVTSVNELQMEWTFGLEIHGMRSDVVDHSIWQKTTIKITDTNPLK